MPDQFDKLHKLQRAGKSEAVLSLLFDKSTGRIKKPYNTDLNHAWYIVGDLLYKKKQYKKAIHAFKKALVSWSSDIEALWAIANCYSNLGKPGWARFYLSKAMQIDKKQDALKYNLANALFDMGKYDEALKHYKGVGKKDKQLFKLARSNIKKIEKLKE